MGKLSKHDDIYAEVLVQAGLGKVLRFDHLRKQWLIWSGVRWRPDTQEEVFERIRQTTLAQIGGNLWDADDQKVLMSLFDSSRKESVLKSLRSRPEIAMSGNEWDRDAYLVGFDNCVVDLRTGQPLAPDPDILVSKSVGCDYNPKAKFATGFGKTELKFDSFIESVMGGDPELVAYLWRFIGYALVGTASEQKFWMWVGGGSNGKGVLARVLAHCFGDYAETPSDTMYMRTRFGSASSDKPRPELLRLQSARFTYMSEPPGGQFNEELLKAHTGEDEIIARDLYSKAGQFARFAPTHKIVFLTNDPPKTDDVGNSMARRVRVVRFEQTYKPDGGKLEEHLKRQHEAIMYHAVVMAMAWWAARELPEPDAVTAWSEEYISENDPLSDFIAARCVEGPNEATGATTMWVAYQEWAVANGVEVMSRTGFGLAIKKRYPRSGRDPKTNTSVYRGLRPKNAAEMAEGGD